MRLILEVKEISDLESVIAKQIMLQNMILQAGQEFGGYCVIRKRGAMGAVYEVAFK